jgi:hypothetical protein
MTATARAQESALTRYHGAKGACRFGVNRRQPFDGGDRLSFIHNRLSIYHGQIHVGADERT